jgi:hypothetical protein
MDTSDETAPLTVPDMLNEVGEDEEPPPPPPPQAKSIIPIIPIDTVAAILTDMLLVHLVYILSDI